jgi:hypothetical protein
MFLLLCPALPSSFYHSRPEVKSRRVRIWCRLSRTLPRRQRERNRAAFLENLARIRLSPARSSMVTGLRRAIRQERPYLGAGIW